VRTLENSFYDWKRIRSDYCESNKSNRKIARDFGLSESAIRKRAKAEGWVKLGDVPVRVKPECAPEEEPVSPRSFGPQDEFAGASVTDLTRRGRNLILDLMSELEFLNRNHQTLVEIVETYVNGEKDTMTRLKLIRALDHETRAKTANNLATALAKLNDAAPGKKQMAEEGAKTAGQGSAWGDDLESGISGRPN